MVNNGNLMFPQATLLPGMGAFSRFAVTGGSLIYRDVNGNYLTLVDSTKNFNGIKIIDVQQPNVHWNGINILFAGIEHRDSSWRIYEIRKDGSGFKKLTFTNRNIFLGQFGAAAYRFEKYDDIDPIYLPDGRIVFASTRYPTLSMSGYPATNLFLTDTLSSRIARITSERNGAEKPSIDPRTGTIIYSRWWQNIDRPSNLTASGLTRDDNLALTSDFGNVWQIASIITDADELKFFAGDPRKRNTIQNYRARMTSQGDMLSVFTPDRAMTVTSGSPGIRFAQHGFSTYKSLAGVDTTTSLFIQTPPSTYTYAGPYATDPVELPDGTILLSYAASPVSSDYAIYKYNLSSNVLTPFFDIPGKLDLNAEVVLPKTPPASYRIGLEDFDTSHTPPTTDPNTFYKGGLFRFDCLNVYSNAPVDAPIDDAPSIRKNVKLRFFLNFQREDPTGKDLPILFREIDVDFDGKIAQGDIPSNVSMFEQMVDSNRNLLRTPNGSIAHVMGLNFGAQGSGTKCVGCHVGHTQIPVATSITEGAFTNLSTSAIVASSSILNNDSAYRAQHVVDRKAKNDDSKVNWISNGTTNEYVDLNWPVAIDVRRLKLYNILANSSNGTNIVVNDCEIYMYLKGNQVRYIPSTGQLNSNGLDINVSPIQMIDRMKVIVKSYTGSVLNRNVAGLAEIEVNARVAYDDHTGIGEPEIPYTYFLKQNFPNPFNPSTKIVFSLARPEYTTLEVFDITGRSIALLISGNLTAGVNNIEFNANNSMPSGVYFYRITTQSFTETKRMVLVK